MINSLRKLSDSDKEFVKRGNQFMVDPRLIKEQPGFNTREGVLSYDEYWSLPEVMEYVDGFARSYRDGKYVQPIVVQVIDGIPYVREGAHRIHGLMRAIEHYGCPIKTTPVVEFQGDDAEALDVIFDANNGKPLNPISVAKGYKRYKDWGWTVEQIAERRNCSVAHVYQMLSILELDQDLQRAIQLGEVTYAKALRGKTLEGVKDARKSAPKKVVKPVIDMFRAFAPVQENDQFVIRLSAEQYEAFRMSQEQLKEFE